MPYFNNVDFFEYSDDSVFTTLYDVSTPAPVSGIYRCTLCGHEMVIDKDRNLPPDGRHNLTASVSKHVIDKLQKSPKGFKWELVAAPKHHDGSINKIQ